MSNNTNIVGVDLGGTNVRAGIVSNDTLVHIQSQKIDANQGEEEVLQQVFTFLDQVITPAVTAIGVGVPGLVDTATGVVYDVINIPSWREVQLREKMEKRYNCPVFINNDANCFALGEFYFGKGRESNSMIGLTIGTGLGAGIVINKKLYSGFTGGAGEFGMIDYLDKYYEYYASGQFFQNVYKTDGELVYALATKGDAEAIKMYEEMGAHLGNAIKMILYALDIELIVIGGSVRHAYTYFEKPMWQQINTLAFQRSPKLLQIKISELTNSGILGAAALCYDSFRG